MKNLIFSYLYYFLHPKLSHQSLGLYPPAESVGFKPSELSWSEVILLSWICYFFVGFYDLAGISFGSSFFMPEKLSEFWLMKKTGSLLVLKIVLTVVFYPLVTYFGLVVNRWFMQTMLRLLGYGRAEQEQVNSILAVSLSSHLLLLIPAFGQGLQGLYATLSQVLGARHQLNLGWGESIFVGLASVIFLLFFILIVFLGIFSVALLV